MHVHLHVGELKLTFLVIVYLQHTYIHVSLYLYFHILSR